MTPDDFASFPNDHFDTAANAADDPPETIGLNDRLWLRALLPILQGPFDEPHPNSRVQFAVERLRIAACERAVRILSADLAPPT